MTRSYRPSNGSEGSDFIEWFCYRCTKNVNEDCSILNATFIYGVNDPKYPKEWVQDEKGPRCSAFDLRPEEGE